LFREQQGTAGLSGRDLPPDEALAPMASVNARAQHYEDSGAFGATRMDVLRAYAYLDLLNGVTPDARIACAEAQDEAAEAAEALAWAEARAARTAAGRGNGTADPDRRDDGEPRDGGDPDSGSTPGDGGSPGDDGGPGDGGPGGGSPGGGGDSGEPGLNGPCRVRQADLGLGGMAEVTGPEGLTQPRAAMLLIVTSGGLLMHHRDDKPGIAHPGCWAGFGGAVEAGETVEEALHREVAEETGLVILDPIFLTDAVDHEGDGRLVSLFYTVGDYRPSDIDLQEGAGVAIHRVAELPALKITPFVRRAIESHLLPVVADGM
jgi:8-oxo-dGTP diphosphatase